jgi:hypothetical protein
MLRYVTEYIQVLKEYLAVRDAYATNLWSTLVLLLVCTESWSLERNLFQNRLRITSNPIDMYLYPSTRTGYAMNRYFAVEFIKLVEYTWFYCDAWWYFLDILNWMVENASKGSFKNLIDIQITNNRIAFLQ